MKNHASAIRLKDQEAASKTVGFPIEELIKHVCNFTIDPVHYQIKLRMKVDKNYRHLQLILGILVPTRKKVPLGDLIFETVDADSRKNLHGTTFTNTGIIDAHLPATWMRFGPEGNSQQDDYYTLTLDYDNVQHDHAML